MSSSNKSDGAKIPEASGPKAKSIRYHKLFRYADALDILLMVFGLLLAAATGFCMVFIIVLFGDILDKLNQDSTEETLQMVRYMVILGGCTWVAGWVMFSCTNSSAERQKDKIRLAYLTGVMRQDVSWFDLNDPGTIPETISGNIENIAMGMGDKVGALAMDMAMFVTGLSFGFYYWWKLALIIIAIIPFLALGSALMGRTMKDLQKENQTWYGRAGACADEVMRALRTVVAFRGEKLECERYTSFLNQARRGGCIAQTKVGAGMGYMMGVMFASYGIAFFAAAHLLRSGERNSVDELYTAGDVLKVFFCILRGGFALGLMGEPLQAIFAATAAGASMFEVIDNMPSIERSASGDSGQKISSIEKIAFENVHFIYPARPDTKVLNGTDLAIDRGQRAALVGESGSGKSTIISLLERFYDPTEGVVAVNGCDIRTLSPNSLRSLMGYVGQEPVLFATSIRQNILYGNPGATADMLNEVQQQAMLDFVQQMEQGLDTFVGTGGSQFSGGQKQRIALARALIKKPELLLLDEATSALDNKSEKMVQHTLDRLGSDSSKRLTTIEVAHRLSTIMHRDIIFVMQRGCVVEQGSHDQLMAKQGVYYSLVAAQQGAAQPRQQRVVTTGTESDMLVPVDNAAAEEMMMSSDRATSVAEAPEVVDVVKLESERQAQILKTYKAPMRRMLAFCKPEWICAVPGVFGALLFGAKEPLLAFVLFDSIGLFYNRDLDAMYEDICGQIWYFFAIAIACFIGGTVSQCSFGMMKEGLTMRMRIATMQHFLRMEVGFHDDPDHTPSKNIFTLETYAFRVGNLMMGFSAYSSVFASLFVGIFLSLFKSWRMGLMMLASIPVMGVAKKISMKMMMGGQASTSEELKTAQQVISDSLNSIKTVRAMGAEDTLIALVGKWSNPVMKRAVKKSVTGGFSFGMAMGMVFFVFAFAFWWAMWLIENQFNTFTEAMQGMGCILFGAMGMGSAMSLLGDLAKAKVACHDLFQLLDRPSLIDGIDPKGETPDGVAEVGRIEFRDVKFFYPFRQDVQVLKGITFSIKEGQSVGLCGPSGGGKSTVLSLLQRFYDPQEGEILITERQLPLRAANIAWWRAQMGYIGQEPILFDTSVRENVLYGMDASSVSQEHLEKCGKMACLGFLKDQDGWETQVGPKGERLSGGQKQRVAICRAIVRNPRIMLLDEATSALDSASEQVVQEALDNVLVARTSFTIAHRLSTIQRCDLILTCAEGTIVESGTHAELMAKGGVYAKLQSASRK